jgi:hypothetical protein
MNTDPIVIVGLARTPLGAFQAAFLEKRKPAFKHA